jgi:class 3 adenylate cyclase
MGLKADLETEVRDIFKSQWTVRDGQVVPEDSTIKLSNDAVNLDATVLYADISDSTQMVDTLNPQPAAEIYKAFLRCAAKVIRSEGGSITAYDGDRVMAVYVGDKKNTRAVRTGLKINWAAKHLIAPLRKEVYPNSAYVLKHVVGIDASKLLVARSGIRGANDLVCIGRAANYAAKLCALSHDFPTWITGDIYKNIDNEAKTANGTNMWEARIWNDMNKMSIYRSTYWWPLS